MKSESASYKAAGVDITAGYAAVEGMKAHIGRTSIPGVLSGIGDFGGLFEPDLTGVQKPVLVSGTDGVGTKLKIAFMMDKHDTVGIDCVAMCVNDVICCGAKPLIFLDYIACGKNNPDRIVKIVSGVADGCVAAGAALVGGETAEMPGFYPEDEYDLAGFCVGLADKERLFDREKMVPGDAVIALSSSGVHSNGFSLVRKILTDKGLSVDDRLDELSGTLGETLLTPTRIYVKSILELAKKVEILSCVNITGGGFHENIPRGLPEGLSARIEKEKLSSLPIFDVIAKLGNVSEHDMYNTFNMGSGMFVFVPAACADEAVRILRELGEDARLVGEAVPGNREVALC